MWTNPTDSNFVGTLIVRKTGSYPVKPTDGTKVYAGAAANYTDTGLTNGTQYYYRAFAYNAKTEYQTSYCVATAIPKGDILASTLPVGAKIKFGKYNDVDIVWNIVDKKHSGYPSNSVTLMTDKIISLKCFDAAEPNNSNSDRQSYGNNRYIYSNLRQWLNSTAAAGQWYTAQHSADAPPNNVNVLTKYNEYDTEAGFLAGFSENMRAALLSTTLVVARNTVTDGGASETTTDKIFLASTAEVGLANDGGVVEGTGLAAFSAGVSRVAYPTAECVSKSECQASNLNISQPVSYYWLRTPSVSSSYRVLCVNSSSTIGSIYAADGSMEGLRPFCNLSGDTTFSANTDSDGCYTFIGG